MAPTKSNGYASPSDFKKETFTDLVLPSGKKCAAVRVGLESFIKSGKVPNALLPMMKGAMNGKAADNKEIMDTIDEQTIADMYAMFDLATVAAVQIPSVHPVPRMDEDGVRRNADGTFWERDEDLLYVDEIDSVDKQFIFQWCVGGTTDVAKFRDGTEAVVADLSAGKAMGNPTKRPARPRR